MQFLLLPHCSLGPPPPPSPPLPALHGPPPHASPHPPTLVTSQIRTGCSGLLSGPPPPISPLARPPWATSPRFPPSPHPRHQPNQTSCWFLRSQCIFVAPTLLSPPSPPLPALHGPPPHASPHPPTLVTSQIRPVVRFLRDPKAGTSATHP